MASAGPEDLHWTRAPASRSSAQRRAGHHQHLLERSKRAEGATRISLKSPEPGFTARTRPTTRPLREDAVEAGGHHHVAHHHVRQHGHVLHHAGRRVRWRRRSRTWPGDHARDAAALDAHARPRSRWSSRSCTLAACGPHGDHAAHHAGGADHGRVQAHAVLAALVEGDACGTRARRRARPPRATSGLQGQHLAQLQQLAQALGLRAPAALRCLQRSLQLAHAARCRRRFSSRTPRRST